MTHASINKEIIRKACLNIVKFISLKNRRRKRELVKKVLIKHKERNKRFLFGWFYKWPMSRGEAFNKLSFKDQMSCFHHSDKIRKACDLLILIENTNREDIYMTADDLWLLNKWL